MCPQKISAQSDEAFPKYVVYKSDFLNIVIYRNLRRIFMENRRFDIFQNG